MHPSEADVRQRCEEVFRNATGHPSFIGHNGVDLRDVFTEMICDAYADGQRAEMERAADRIVTAHKSTDSDKWLDLASELKTQAADGAAIRQAAGEVK